MKKRRIRNVGFSFVGAIGFFALVATIMQIAILVYDYIVQRTDDKPLIAILIFILILILSAVITVIDLIRRKVTVEKPVNKILSATEKIAKGDFSVELEIEHDYDKYNQYDVIMENINAMSGQLRKTEILKTDFISNVSHEIKTPLAVIQNYAGLLKSDDLTKDERAKYAETLRLASKRITDLITNILRLNKLENQQIQEKPETFSITEALSEAIVDIESLIEKKGINLSCDLDDIVVHSTRTLLELIWNNLLSNAVKFTNEGGEIEISLKQKGKDVHLSVKDNGLGMSPEIGSRIFEKFYQGDGSHSKEGNGLGLALVKKVIDVLGGEISVNSEIGKGSTFTVLLRGIADER